MAGRALARARRVPPVAFLLVVFLLLLIVSLSHWRYYHLFRESKIQDMQARMLSAVGSLAAQVERERPWVLEYVASIPGADSDTRLLAELAQTPLIARLDDLAEEQQAIFRLAQAAILTTSGVSVAGDEWRFSDLDQPQIARAIEGQPALTDRYEIDGRTYQRAYAPIHSTLTGDSADASPPGTARGGDQVVGMAAVSLSPDFIDQLISLERRAARQTMVSGGLLLILAASLWRLMRHSRRLEERALQGARAEAMGALAGGLAHELRNPLGIIRMLGEEAASMEPAESQVRENLRDILREVDRLSNLTNRFLSLARAPDPANADAPPPSIDIEPEIRAVVGLAAKGAPDNLRISVGSLPNLRASVEPEALRQILLNLILNAQDAIASQPGTITIAANTRRDHVEITVTDSGPGMDPKTLARIFEPFFTTKPAGSGLGLAISRAVAENAGGSLTIKSAPGRGTTAILSLPGASQQG